MLFSGVLMCGMFFPVPNFLGAVTGLTALPATPGQGPLLAALALRLGNGAEYSDRFFECRHPVLKGIDPALAQVVIQQIQTKKDPKGQIPKKP
jgi:hypothetical protein